MIKSSLQLVRHMLTGILILLIIITTIPAGCGIRGFALNPLGIAGIDTWLAALLLFIDTSWTLKFQVPATDRKSKPESNF